MSVRAMAWAFKVRCPSPTAKLVLIKLCDCANDDNEAWPSQARIADECQLSRETVNRTIKQLVDIGLIENRPQTKNGAQTVSRYFVRCDAGSHPPVTDDHTPVIHDHTPPVTDDHTEPSSLEPSIRKKEEAPLRGANEKESADLFATPTETKNGTRGSRLPTDWQPSADECTFAAQCGLDPIGIADRFRDYWTAKPGAGGVKLDWPATWRNWCRSEMERQSRYPAARPGSNGSGGSKLLAAVRRIDTSAARARMGR